jgi:hypothetical protein
VDLEACGEVVLAANDVLALVEAGLVRSGDEVAEPPAKAPDLSPPRRVAKMAPR